jgi:hypothetical protein
MRKKCSRGICFSSGASQTRYKECSGEQRAARRTASRWLIRNKTSLSLWRALSRRARGTDCSSSSLVFIPPSCQLRDSLPSHRPPVRSAVYLVHCFCNRLRREGVASATQRVQRQDRPAANTLARTGARDAGVCHDRLHLCTWCVMYVWTTVCEQTCLSLLAVCGPFWTHAS